MAVLSLGLYSLAGKPWRARLRIVYHLSNGRLSLVLRAREILKIVDYS